MARNVEVYISQCYLGAIVSSFAGVALGSVMAQNSRLM